MADDPSKPDATAPLHADTRLVHAGRDRRLTAGGVNPVVQRASTLLVERADQLYAGGKTYGIHGTATHAALIDALSQIEGAAHCALVPSGLLACTVPLFALAGAGDHILLTDNAYGPTRRFCERSLGRWGADVEYFDPAIGAGIARLMRPNTRLIFMESPGSLTFELCDTRAIVAAAKAAGAVTAMDNTWSAGVFHKPLDLGVDISIQATTKYASGAADVLNGAILTRDDALAARLANAIADLGLNVSPDDAYLVLRGLRTLAARLDRHQASALDVARWLQARPEVRQVLHPALPGAPGHDLWRRDFTGSTGLFGIVLQPAPQAAVHAFLDALKLFGLGFSWGGFESLAIHADPDIRRNVRQPALSGPLIRISIGLEDVADLKTDLDAGFAALRAAG